MKRHHYEKYRALHNCGVEVGKERIPPMNAGGESETVKHITAKTLTAYIAARNWGYMTDMEVAVPNGEIDVLLWGLDDRLTYAVECETSPTEEVKNEKMQKYVRDIRAVDDMVLLNLNEMPVDMLEAKGWIQEQL